jgi:hypothetical protein
MKRLLAAMMILFAVSVGAPAHAKVVDLSASPNPAVVSDRVRHAVSVGAHARLDVWVSAAGFERPRLGTLPPGTWSYECCPGQVAGTDAWHYRSSSLVTPGSYRFGAIARSRGTFLSTAASSASETSVWIRIR